jgi:hypothetical protein
VQTPEGPAPRSGPRPSTPFTQSGSTTAQPNAPGAHRLQFERVVTAQLPALPGRGEPLRGARPGGRRVTVRLTGVSVSRCIGFAGSVTVGAPSRVRLRQRSPLPRRHSAERPTVHPAAAFGPARSGGLVGGRSDSRTLLELAGSAAAERSARRYARQPDLWRLILRLLREEDLEPWPVRAIWGSCCSPATCPPSAHGRQHGLRKLGREPLPRTLPLSRVLQLVLGYIGCRALIGTCGFWPTRSTPASCRTWLPPIPSLSCGGAHRGPSRRSRY